MLNQSYPKVVPYGDSAMAVEFGASISPRVNRQVHALADTLVARPITGVLDVVPAYASLTVFYDPAKVHAIYPDVLPGRALEIELTKRYRETAHAPTASAREVELPVCYQGEFGPDLAKLAWHHGCRQEEVIALHTQCVYTVYMLGFAPGFAYLGGLDERLHTPRRSSPRERIPAGSVGIGGAQTGVYPLATPGGWQIIGRTPVALFRPDEDAPSLLRPGDRLRFRPISTLEFEHLTKEKLS